MGEDREPCKLPFIGNYRHLVDFARDQDFNLIQHPQTSSLANDPDHPDSPDTYYFALKDTEVGSQESLKLFFPTYLVHFQGRTKEKISWYVCTIYI